MNLSSDSIWVGKEIDPADPNDAGMAELFQEFGNAGWSVVQLLCDKCCHDTLVLEFPWPTEAEDFLDVLDLNGEEDDGLCDRLRQRCAKDGGWNYKTNLYPPTDDAEADGDPEKLLDRPTGFKFWILMQIPKSDLPEVTRRLQAHNAR